MNGEAVLTLTPSEKGTEFRYQADVQVGGQNVRLGQRMISGIVKEMAGQFFEAFERWGAAEDSLVEPPAPISQPNAFFSALQLLWRTLLNLLGLSKRS